MAKERRYGGLWGCAPPLRHPRGSGRRVRRPQPTPKKRCYLEVVDEHEHSTTRSNMDHTEDSCLSTDAGQSVRTLNRKPTSKQKQFVSAFRRAKQTGTQLSEGICVWWALVPLVLLYLIASTRRECESEYIAFTFFTLGSGLSKVHERRYHLSSGVLFARLVIINNQYGIEMKFYVLQYVCCTCYQYYDVAMRCNSERCATCLCVVYNLTTLTASVYVVYNTILIVSRHQRAQFTLRAYTWISIIYQIVRQIHFKIFN